MEKSWGNIVPPKVKSKAKKRKDTREEYLAYIEELNNILPDKQLREMGESFGTKKLPVDHENICRVVPSDWIQNVDLLYLNRERYIYPEHVIKERYHAIKQIIGRKRD